MNTKNIIFLTTSLNSQVNFLFFKNIIKEFIQNKKKNKIFLAKNSIKGLYNNSIFQLSELFLHNIKNISKFNLWLGKDFFVNKNSFDFKKLEDIEKLFIDHNIGTIIILGGNKLLYFAKLLLKIPNIKVIFIPLVCAKDPYLKYYSLGSDSLINSFMQSVFKIKKNSLTFNRCCIVKVSQYIPDYIVNLTSYVTDSTLAILKKEKTIDELVSDIENIKKNGQEKILLLVKDNLYNTTQLMKKISEGSKFDTKELTFESFKKNKNISFLDLLYYKKTLNAIINFEKILEKHKNNRFLLLHFQNKDLKWFPMN